MRLKPALALWALALFCQPSQALAQDKKQGPLSRFRRRLKRVDGEGRLERRLAGSHLRGAIKTALRPPQPHWKPARSGRGSLELVDGIPILRLRGSPEEMGRQHGELVGHAVRVLVHDYVPNFLGSDYSKARRRARAFLPFIPKAYLREIRAMAKAAGVSFDDALIGHVFPDLYRTWGCSCVTASGPARKGGAAIFGRNLDFIDMGFLHRFSILIVYQPEHGVPFVSIGFPGMIGVISGMNRAGLSCGVMVVHSDSGCRPGLPFGLAFRRLLEEGSNVDDAERSLLRTEVTVTNNLMVVDHSNAARVFELAPSSEPAERCVVRRPTPAGLLFSTNHFQAPTRRGPRLSFVYLSSCKRLNDLKKTCAGEAGVTDRDVKAGLRSTGPKLANVQAMIFRPAELSVEVAFGKPPAAKRRYVKFELARLFTTKERGAGR